MSNPTRIVGVSMAVTSLTAWLGFIWLHFYLFKISPHIPDVSAGFIYPIDQHGSMVYINYSQHMLRIILIVIAVSTFSIAILCDRILKRRLTNKGSV